MLIELSYSHSINQIVENKKMNVSAQKKNMDYQEK
jgi:hypothetical protein